MPTDTTGRTNLAPRFAARAIAWSLGLFGLLRLPWIETHLVLPVTQLQARLGASLCGPPTGTVVATLDCSGTDALALCLGVILAYPARWRLRLAGAALGLALTLGLNTVRIGTLGRAVESPAWFQALHVYVWPGILVVLLAGYVFGWMRFADRQGPSGSARAEVNATRQGSAWRTRRFVVLTAAFLVVFVASSPVYLSSPAVLAVAALIARAAAALLRVTGVDASVVGNILSTPRGGFGVTQECISTPLIPVYLAAVLAYARTWRWRTAGLLAAVPLFVGLGIARLLVVAVPATLAPSPLFLVHAFFQLMLAAVIVVAFACWRHGVSPAATGRAALGLALAVAFVQLLGTPLTRATAGVVEWLGGTAAVATATPDDPQQAIAMLPAFQVAFFLAIWVAGFLTAGWKRWLAGLALLEATQVATLLALHLLGRAAGLTPHVREIRAWAVVAPLLVVAAVTRARWRRPQRTPPRRPSSTAATPAAGAARPADASLRMGAGTGARDVAVVSAVALLLTLVLAAPVLRAPSERIFGVETVGRHHDPFTVMRQFEVPWTAGAYSQPVTDLPGKLLARVAGPVAACNWLVLLTFPLSAAAAFLLARHFALSPFAAAVAALAYAFSPFHLAQAAYHPHIAQTQWLPLYLLALFRCLDAPTMPAMILLAASGAAVALSNFYGGLIAAAVTPVALVTYWWFVARGGARDIRRLAITTSVLAMLAAAGLGYAWWAARPVLAQSAAFAFPRADLFRYSAKWWSYLVPPVSHPVLGESVRRFWTRWDVREGLLEQQVSLGWGLVALGVLAGVAWLLERRTRGSAAPGGSRFRHRDQRQTLITPDPVWPIAAAVAAVALVCSLSPERTIGAVTMVRPSALIYHLLPMFRAYARFGVAVQLMAAMLAGAGLDALRRTGTRTGAIVSVALVALIAGEYAVSPADLWRDVLPTDAHRWLEQQPPPSRALDCSPVTIDSASVRWLTDNRIQPLGSGFDDCAEPHVAGKLAAAGFTDILVPHDAREAQWLSRSAAASGLQIRQRFRGADVYSVTATPPVIAVQSMAGFFRREYDRDRTWRWMGGGATWIIVNRRDRDLVATLDLELAAFQGKRQLGVRVDAGSTRILTAGDWRVHSVGPLTLTPGPHEIAFRAIDPPVAADAVSKNGDKRALSFQFGAWQWRIEGGRP